MKSDNPIQAKEDDLLNRYPFAENLVADLLASFENGQHSVVIGINGEWGSGKSSFMEFIEMELNNQLGSESSNIIFRFNPWMFSGQTDLQNAFLYQLGTELGSISNTGKKQRKDLVLLSLILELGNALNPEPVSRTIFSTLRSLVKETEQKPTTIKEIRNKIEKTLRSGNIKIFVFIDDIDRLNPNEVTEILRLVRLNASFRNTYYFLAYDSKIIAEYISESLKIDGRQYLEKIIQLDYSLPKISNSDLKASFKQKLETISEKYKLGLPSSEITSIWLNLKDFIKNIRDIKRYFNSIQLRIPRIKKDIFISDYLLIEALRIFDHPTYTLVSKQIFHLTVDSDSFLLLDREDERVMPVKEVLQGFKTIKAESKKILSLLFYIKINNTEVKFEKIINREKISFDKRIVHTNYFERYFTLKLPDNYFSQVEIDRILKLKTSDLKEEINRATELNLLFQFLDRIYYSVSPKRYSRNLFKSFFDFSDEKKLKIISQPSIQYNAFELITIFLGRIGGNLNEQGFLKEILTNHKSFTRFHFLIKLNQQLEGMDEDGNTKQGMSLAIIHSNILLQNKDRVLNQYIKSLSYFFNQILDTPSQYPIGVVKEILILGKNLEQYTTKINTLLGTTETALMLLKCCLNRGDLLDFYNLVDDSDNMLSNLSIGRFDNILGSVFIDDYKGGDKIYLKLFHKLKEQKFDPEIKFNLMLEKMPSGVY